MGKVGDAWKRRERCRSRVLEKSQGDGVQSSTVNLAFAGGRDGAVIVTDKKAEDRLQIEGLVNRVVEN